MGKRSWPHSPHTDMPGYWPATGGCWPDSPRTHSQVLTPGFGWPRRSAILAVQDAAKFSGERNSRSRAGLGLCTNESLCSIARAMSLANVAMSLISVGVPRPKNGTVMLAVDPLIRLA